MKGRATLQTGAAAGPTENRYPSSLKAQGSGTSLNTDPGSVTPASPSFRTFLSDNSRIALETVVRRRRNR